MKKEKIDLKIGDEIVVVNLQEMSYARFCDLINPSEFIFKIVKSGNGSELENKCKQLTNQMLVDTDGKGSLSNKAIDHSDRIVSVTNQEKSLLACCAISFLTGNDKVLDGNVLDYSTVVRKNAVYIEQIVVSDDYKRQGIATQLIEYVQNEFGAKYIYIYAHVSVNNIPSTSLHLKSGFRAVNWYHSDNFFGIENYNSIFLKKIRKKKCK